jgi:hypothetical protein
MRGKLLTLVATAAMLVGGLVWTDTADAQRRWYRGGYYGGYYGAPVVRTYRPYYAYPYRYSYYRPYGYYRYSYGYPGYYGGYYRGYPGYYSSPGVYLGGRNAGFYFRF